MSLPARQRRALNQIEKALTGDQSGPGPLFAIFTRLTRHEPMPLTERVTVSRRRWQLRQMRGAAVTFVGLAVFAAVLLTLSLTLPDRPMCSVTAAPTAGRILSAPARRQPVCAAEPSQPGKSSEPRPATIGVDP
jgi:hypothetical protein